MGTTSETAEEAGEDEALWRDFPTGHEEATWWPVACTIGLIGLYFGAGLYFFGTGENAPIPPTIGPVVFALGSLGFIAGAFGWFYQGFLVDFWTRSTEGREPGALRGAMILFILTDIATFSAGFVYYAFIRVDQWPPGELPELLTPVLIVNTVALVASSFTLHYAHQGLEEGNRRGFLGLLGVTILLGVIFVSGQIYEYYTLVVHEGFTFTTGIFGSAFFGLTGLHGLHVLAGTIFLGILFARGLLGQLSDGRDTSMVTVSYYWHFVDIVWVFIIALLYFGAEFSL
jgi:cytochrome c oxidase subunit III